MLTLHVNGRALSAEAGPGITLLEFLHDLAEMPDTRRGCEEGRCGACTVLVDGEPVRACMVTAESMAGRAVTTLAGLASGERLHEVQRAFLSEEAIECGFCTPGMILEAVALLDEGVELTAEQIHRRMAGHLCKCGKGPEIVRAVMAAAQAMR